MGFIFETIFEVYVELMMYIVPEEKATSKKYRVLAIIIAFLAMMGILALFLWGWILLFERHNFWGLLPFSLAILLSLAQMILGFIFHKEK